VVTFPPALQKLIRELSKLPTIGEKTATRLAYHLVQNDRALADSLGQVLQETVSSIKFCQHCFFFSEGDLCVMCQDSERDTSTICVLEKPIDLLSIERMGEYKGSYHILHGLWAPLRGQGPESMKLEELSKRLREEDVQEVILATSSTVEGDATALYIARIVEEFGIKTTRLGQGMPKGGELEYADEVTLSRAFSRRDRLSA